MTDTIPVMSVKKALDLLDLIIEADLSGQSVSLSDLAVRMKIPLNTGHNLLKTMIACGYVRQQGRGRYAPGLKCRQLARMEQLQTPSVREAVTGAMRRFAQTQGEDCVLTVLVNGERVVTGRADAARAVCISTATVEKVPFFEKPTGRLLAAFADEGELQQIIARQGLPGAKWNNINDLPTLRTELAKLRKRGWCRVEQVQNDLITWACPIIGADGIAWGVLGAYAPSFRCPPKRCTELLNALRALARELSSAVPNRLTPQLTKKGNER